MSAVLQSSALGYDPAGANASSRTATLPGGDGPTLSTDILYAHASCEETGATFTWPAGWTVDLTDIGPSYSGVGSHETAKRTGTTATSVTVTVGASSRKFSVALARVRGGVYSSLGSTIAQLPGGTAVKDWATITPAAGENLILAFAYARNAQGVTTGPASFTNVHDLVSNDGGVSVRHSLYKRTVTPASGSYTPQITYASGLNDWGGVLVSFVEVPPDPGIDVDVHDPDGVFIAGLTDAFGKSFRVELDGTGQFEFWINRHSPEATAINLARDNVVKFTVPQISSSAIFAGFLEVGDFDLNSTDEEGGENLRFGGRGLLAYLERDVSWTTSYVLETEPTDGYWRFAPASHPSWSTGNEPGQILRRIIDEMQHVDRPQHCMDLLTVDFDYEDDSDGDDWATTDATDPVWTVAVGETVLETLGRLIATGVLEAQMDPDFGLHAYNRYGRDLTGPAFGAGVVRFVKGVNIADKVNRQWNGADVAPYELVAGDSGHYIRAELPSAAGMVQKVVFNQFAGTNNPTLEALGLADLEQRQIRSDSAAFSVPTRRIGGTETADDDGAYLPGPEGTNGDYWVGDTVTLVTGATDIDYDEQDVRVAAISIAELDAGNLTVIPELGSTTGQARSGGGTYGGGGIVAPPGATGGMAVGHGALSGRNDDEQHQAAAVSYDNGASGLAADDVQAAIDELASTPPATALDDLTDVAITAPAAGDRLRYSGSAWVNSGLIWKPVMDGLGNVVTDSGTGEAIMAEVSP